MILLSLFIMDEVVNENHVMYLFQKLIHQHNDAFERAKAMTMS